MGMKVILPRKLLNTPGLVRAIENALTGAAKNVKVDFDTTTQTWHTRPTFTIDREPGKRTVSTDDPPYPWVNDGTPRHIIAPKKPGGVLVYGVPSSPKTAVRVIGSSAGSRGSTIVRTPKPVQHPGSDAREFDEEIKEKWDDKLPGILQRAIDAEMS